MAEPFAPAKAVKSLVTPLAWFKAFMIGVMIFGMLSLGWFIYVGAIKPHYNPIPTTTQSAEEMQINYITETNDSFFLGVKFLGFKVGISKPVKVKPKKLKPSL